MKTCSVCTTVIATEGEPCTRCGQVDGAPTAAAQEAVRQGSDAGAIESRLHAALGVSAAVGAVVAWVFRPASVLLPAVVFIISAILYFRNVGAAPTRVAKSDWIALIGESTLALLCAAAGAFPLEAILLAVVAATAFLVHARTRRAL